MEDAPTTPQSVTVTTRVFGTLLDGLQPDTMDADECVGLIATLRDLRADIALAIGGLDRAVVEKKGVGRWIVNGIGEVVVRRSTKRTAWQHDDLLAAIIARIMDEPETIYDPETAELLPYAQIGHNVTRRLRECVGFGAGKVTGLRALGIQPDEYCIEEADGYSVSVPATRLAV